MIDLTFTGRIGRDAEVRRTQSGKLATSFTAATDIGWGENKKTLWIDCVIWEERGEKLAQYLIKGQSVTIRGTPTVRSWLKDGDAKAALQCTVREIELQGGKQSGERQNERQTSELDDGIPF